MTGTKRNSAARWVALPAVALVGLLLGSARGAPYEASIDATNRLAWGEQIGWVNHRAMHGETTVCVDGSNGYMKGYAWAENAGWIKLGTEGGGPYLNTTASNWGVNLYADWSLSGYAWSESTGWLNFRPTHGGVELDPVSGDFRGYAWSENAGWIHLGATNLTYRLTASMPQTTNGVPHWWLWQYGFTNNFGTVSTADPDGDGMATWQEYVAATDPTNAASVFMVKACDTTGTNYNVVVTNPDTGEVFTQALLEVTGIVLRWPSSSNRWYRVMGQLDFSHTSEVYTAGMPATPPQNLYTVAVDTASQRLFHVEVGLTP